MFSTIPSTGTSTFRNMLRPFFASISDRSWGVETITAPAIGTRCAMVSCASPVPGGISTTSTSCGPHCTSPIICSSAPITIGPRQIIGVSCGTRKPIDMQVTPWASIGMMILPSGEDGRPEIPIMVGRDGP